VSADLIDPEAFVFGFPVWTVADGEKHGQRGFPTSIVLLTVLNKGDVMAVFTDVDLARRFIEEMPLPGKVPVELLTEEDLRAILSEFQRIKGDYVVFDVSARPQLRGRFCPVKQLLDSLPADPSVS
jgi:hypothetical protein